MFKGTKVKYLYLLDLSFKEKIEFSISQNSKLYTPKILIKVIRTHIRSIYIGINIRFILISYEILNTNKYCNVNIQNNRINEKSLKGAAEIRK